MVAFADTGQWRAFTGPVIETIQPYHIAQKRSGSGDGPGLFDEVIIPIALVGTSFSAREEFSFPKLLKAELQADLTSYALEGLGPFEPMQRFLQDTSVFQNPPQIVI